MMSCFDTKYLNKRRALIVGFLRLAWHRKLTYINPENEHPLAKHKGPKARDSICRLERTLCRTLPTHKMRSCCRPRILVIPRQRDFAFLNAADADELCLQTARRYSRLPNLTIDRFQRFNLGNSSSPPRFCVGFVAGSYCDSGTKLN
jgi:hypothetical protein